MKDVLLGKGVLIAGLLLGAPAVAAVFIAGHQSKDQSAASGWTSAVFGPGSTLGAVAERMGIAGGKGAAVSSSEELRRAIEAAQDGNVIRLMPGHYPKIVITNVKKTGNITIVSADLARPAVVGELVIRNSSGLTLRDVELAADAGALMNPRGQFAGDESPQPAPQADARPGAGGRSGRFIFIVANSQRITLDRLNVHGPADNREVAFRLRPLIVRDSRDVTVSGSRFSHMWHGLEMLNLDGFRALNNDFSNLRTDAIRGGDVSNVEIAGNVIADFYPEPADHPDGIQLWSTPRGTKLTNISIHNNLIVRGKGGVAQGIFLRDVKNNFAFQNVDIRDNLVMGGLYNAIAINSVQGGKIENNKVVNYPDRVRTWIRIDNSRDIEMRNNSAPHYLLTRSTVDQSGNKTDRRGKVDEARDVTEWLDAKPDRRRAGSALQQRLSGRAGS